MLKLEYFSRKINTQMLKYISGAVKCSNEHIITNRKENCPTHYILLGKRKKSYRPIGGRSAEWTQLDSTHQYTN
jgi:aspartate carbamoyltransferase regulatory subunit